MAGQQPRFVGDFWVGHGELAVAMGNKHYSNDKPGLAQVIADNWGAFGDLMGAFKGNLEEAGYAVASDGTVTGPGWPVGTEPPAPTPTVPPGAPVPFVANALDTPTRKVMSAMPQGVVHTISGSGKKKVSWTIGSGGYPCFLSFDPTFPEGAGTGGSTGGTPWVNSPDGNWTVYLFYAADPGRVQKATVDIYNA